MTTGYSAGQCPWRPHVSYENGIEVSYLTQRASHLESSAVKVFFVLALSCSMLRT